MKDGPVILMPTFDRYRWLASFTERQLDHWWPGHPPVWRCGCSAPADDRYLPLRRDSRDWMGIALDAARELEQRGARQAYVILDDIPPVGPCHAEHLNATIPRWMDELDAACIGLNGWGQGRLPAGNAWDAARLDLQRVAPSFAWRFPLHPTLWRVRAFIEILEALTQVDHPQKRSAWAFERRAGETLGSPAARWSELSFRVCGPRMVSPTFRIRRPLALWLQRRVTGALHGAARVLGRDAAADAIQRRALWLHRPYVGPYPLVHSGLMSAGRPNPHFLRFMRAHGDRTMLGEFLDAARAAGVETEAV